MRRSIKIILPIGIALLVVVVILSLLIQLSIIRPVERYRIRDLIVTSPGGTRVIAWRLSDWYTIKTDENVIFKITSFEPVVRRYEFITHEVITVSYRGTWVIPSMATFTHLSPEKSQVATLTGLMVQKFLQEGFEIGGKSSFMKIAGADAYRFELIKHGVETEYTWHIILVWKEDWYIITYSNFDTPSPGSHFSDFERFIEELELAR